MYACDFGMAVREAGYGQHRVGKTRWVRESSPNASHLYRQFVHRTLLLLVECGKSCDDATR